MKTVTVGRYSLSFFAAAATLAGCAGLTQVPNPVAQTSLRSVPNSSDDEVLTGKAKLIKPCHRTSGKHSRYQSWSTGFSVSGKATGPFPGTFTASGYWSGGCNIVHQCSSFFHETVTIMSGSSTISGTMQTFDRYGLLFTCTEVQNLTVPYTSGSVSGNAVINIIQKQDFNETLAGL